MKRALQVLSLVTLVGVIAATVAQALTVTQGITYDPNGQPLNPSALTQWVTILGITGMLAIPLVALTFTLGLVVAGLDHRPGWLVAILIAGALSFVGVLGVIWVLLSANIPVAFQTPMALVPLATLLYTVMPARQNATTSVAL